MAILELELTSDDLLLEDSNNVGIEVLTDAPSYADRIAATYNFNTITREWDLTDGGSKIPEFATTPVGAQEGDLYLNSTDSIIYIFFDNSWQSTGITLTPASQGFIELEGTTDDIITEDSKQIDLE